MPIEINYDDLKLKEPDNPALLTILKELEFTSLLKYVTQEPDTEAEYHTVLEEQDFQDMVKRALVS